MVSLQLKRHREAPPHPRSLPVPPGSFRRHRFGTVNPRCDTRRLRIWSRSRPSCTTCSLDGLTERTPGTFYRRSRAFLHFHADPAGIFADVRPRQARRGRLLSDLVGRI